jgi:hypothetical protein
VRRGRICAGAIALACAVAGCRDDPVAPEGLVLGRYELVTANGESLPYLIEESPPNVFYRLLSASIDFHTRSRAIADQQVEMLDARITPNRVESRSIHATVTYVARDDRVLVTYPFEPVYTDTATVSDDRAHVLVRSRFDVPSGVVVLDLLYAKAP